MNAPQSGLFWRMALFVGAALAMFTALAVGSLALVASQELANYTATRHGNLGRQAAAILTERGQNGLQQWLRDEAQIPSDVTVYVLDDRGRDLLGRALPDLYRSFIERSVVRPGLAETAQFRPVRLAPQLIAPDGSRYSFLVLPNRIGILGSPATTLGVLAAALLVIASIAWLIARTFARPMAELQVTVRELASGQTSARVPAAISGRRDEIGALATDFNAMAERIDALLANRQQLMSELSHELRSPLARLRATVGLAEHRGGLSATESRRIEQEIARMDRLIGDLLRYSRLEASVPPQRRLVRLESLLQELVDDEELEARAGRVRLVLRSGQELKVVGDPILLRSAVENVVRNAIRHSPSDAAIDIDASAAGSDVMIRIADRGPGVPADQLERIFEPFVRAAGSVDDDRGSGLGLAIARRVCAAHGGQIAAALRDGGGLCVTIRLPLAQFS